MRAGRDRSKLQTNLVSAIFGQGRSDYLPFIDASIPTVFFSDSTGRCYHTAQDEYDVVNFDKLLQQSHMGQRVVRSLANTDTPPTFVADRPLATYDDAVALQAVFDKALTEPQLFTPANVVKLTTYSADFHRVVGEARRRSTAPTSPCSSPTRYPPWASSPRGPATAS